MTQCVPEKLELKRQMIAQLDELAPHDAIIASNSSSYTISEIIDGLSLSNERRVLSAHSCTPLPFRAVGIKTDNSDQMKTGLLKPLVSSTVSHGIR